MKVNGAIYSMDHDGVFRITLAHTVDETRHSRMTLLYKYIDLEGLDVASHGGGLSSGYHPPSRFILCNKCPLLACRSSISTRRPGQTQLLISNKLHSN